MSHQQVDSPEVPHPGGADRMDDPTLVRETIPSTGDDGTANHSSVLRSSRAIQSERRATMLEHYGGVYWGSAFIGFAVATFFTVVFLGIVGGIVGAVGYQLGAPTPKIGGSLTGASQSLTTGALVGSLIALFIAYVIGGYTAGRMARFDGPKNGLGVVVWTVVVAIVFGIAGGIAGNRFNVASQLHLKIDTGSATTAGAISIGVALLVMVVAATIGGWMGERYHRAIDRDAEALR